MADENLLRSSEHAPASAADGDRSAGDRSSVANPLAPEAVRSPPPNRRPTPIRDPGLTAALSRRARNPEPPPGRRPPFALAAASRCPWLARRRRPSPGRRRAAGGRCCCGSAARSRGGREPAVDLSPRLAAIEKQLNDLAARPAPASVDPKAIDDIAARLARLESAQAAPRAPVTDPVVLGRLNAAENATKSLADNVARCRAAPRPPTPRSARANGRIDKLTAALTDVQTTARSAAAGSDRASRLAVAASALRNAVEHGDPFTAELAIVKPLAPDANAVALLEPFAASGVPSNAVLGQELAAIVRPMLRAAASRRATAAFSTACRPTPRSSSASARSARRRAATTAPRSWPASSSAPRRATSPAR